MKKNKFKIEYLIYIFIIITPFLDVIACVFRNIFPNAVISPSTVLRPIIPLVLLLYIFFKDKKWRKYIVISAIILILYGGIHLWLYKGIITGVSYGSIFSELQYIINYTYMIYVLFIFVYFIKKNGLPYLKKSLFIMLCVYLMLLYVSIITGTSYPTYVEGIGYRGWFISGNSLSVIFMMLSCILISSLIEDRKIYKYIVLILMGIYLMFLIGTRTGLFGFLMVLGFYIVSSILLNFIKNKKISYKKIGIGIGVLVILIGGIFVIGSSTLERRKYLGNEDTGIIDINTGDVGHTTVDTSNMIYQIKNNTLVEGYLSDEQKNAYLELYRIANEKKFKATDRRKQEFVYQYSLIKEQKNILYILFGNGYLASYGELILEIELFAILFNFGILGFAIYLGPFIFMMVVAIKKLFKNKKINSEIIMNIFGLLLSIGLSCFMGAMFFSVSGVLLITCIISLLIKEGENL